MAFQSIWYYSDIPKDIVRVLEEDLSDKFESNMADSRLHGDALNKDKRNSKNAWVPTHHWTAGFVWHYIERANRENFLYDIRNIDGESMQFTRYGEGEFYNWHQDADLDRFYKPQLIPGSDTNMSQDQVALNGEYVRKLSFALQLSDPTDYTGGEVQFLDNSGETFFAPKQRGTLMVFDSRVKHRVRKVRSGLRKSLVGWVVGPRWK